MYLSIYLSKSTSFLHRWLFLLLHGIMNQVLLLRCIPSSDAVFVAFHQSPEEILTYTYLKNLYGQGRDRYPEWTMVFTWRVNTKQHGDVVGIYRNGMG